MFKLPRIEMQTQTLASLPICPRSVTRDGQMTCALARQDSKTFLAVQGDVAAFQNPVRRVADVWLFPRSPENANALRGKFAWLRPVPLSVKPSFGFGDRLGMATPGHVRAVRGTQLAPIFAQQSVRENSRTGRTPRQVIDDAMWGVFEEGWRAAWGADADHIKRVEDVASFVNAGYTFYTVDPGDYVDDAAAGESLAALKQKAEELPWNILQSSPQEMYDTYLARSFHLPEFALEFDEPTLLRACAKYGRALAHAAIVYHEIAVQKRGEPFDFEISVDETAQPTSFHEHLFIANELKRIGVRWTSLAPRFGGRFEKGVDYIGDLASFENELAQHAAIARHFGNYRLSLHSGSDKFSLYAHFAEKTDGVFHIKTAGTSYLEALRTVARGEPVMFRAILDFARERYPTDRATYHVSAQVERIPRSETLSDTDLAALLNHFDARQVLHVTFGSVLEKFGASLHAALAANLEAYYDDLVAHFRHHLAPLIRNH